MGGVSASKDASEPLTTHLGLAGSCGAIPGALLCFCADTVITPRSSPGGAIPGPGCARLQTKPGYLGPWETGTFPLSNTTENLNLIFPLCRARKEASEGELVLLL